MLRNKMACKTELTMYINIVVKYIKGLKHQIKSKYDYWCNYYVSFQFCEGASSFDNHCTSVLISVECISKCLRYAATQSKYNER